MEWVIKILTSFGVPGKIIGGILLIGGIVVGTVVGVRFYDSHEAALHTSIQYIPVSEHVDSILLVKITEIKVAVDSIKKDVKTVKATQTAINKVNNLKFDLLIGDKASLKSTFDGINNSLEYFKQLTSENQKKKLTPYDDFRNEFTILK